MFNLFSAWRFPIIYFKGSLVKIPLTPDQYKSQNKLLFGWVCGLLLGGWGLLENSDHEAKALIINKCGI